MLQIYSDIWPATPQSVQVFWTEWKQKWYEKKQIINPRVPSSDIQNAWVNIQIPLNFSYDTIASLFGLLNGKNNTFNQGVRSMQSFIALKPPVIISITAFKALSE